MSEEVKEVKHETVVEFKEKKVDKVKAWAKSHKKGLIAGGLAAAGTVAGIIGFKKFGGKAPEFTSWTDDSGADHVSWVDNSNNVEVITTPDD